MSDKCFVGCAIPNQQEEKEKLVVKIQPSEQDVASTLGGTHAKADKVPNSRLPEKSDKGLENSTIITAHDDSLTD